MLPALWNIRWIWLLWAGRRTPRLLAPSYRPWLHPRRRTGTLWRLGAREPSCPAVALPSRSISREQLGECLEIKDDSHRLFTEGVPELSICRGNGNAQSCFWACHWRLGWLRCSITLESIILERLHPAGSLKVGALMGEVMSRLLTVGRGGAKAETPMRQRASSARDGSILRGARGRRWHSNQKR